MKESKNVVGGMLVPCSFDPLTGYYRNGCCDTDEDDLGCHTVCVVLTEEFLQFSASVGNDLSSPTPWFPGLQAGQRWCLCASRWAQALAAGCAPGVVLESTHIETLRYASLDDLMAYAVGGLEA